MRLYFTIMSCILYAFLAMGLIITSLGAGCFFWADLLKSPALGAIAGFVQFLLGLTMFIGPLAYFMTDDKKRK